MPKLILTVQASRLKCAIKFLNKTYVVGTQKNCLDETVALSTQNKCLNRWLRKYLQNKCTLKVFDLSEPMPVHDLMILNTIT